MLAQFKNNKFAISKSIHITVRVAMRVYCAILNLNSKFIAISFYTMENENSSLTYCLGGGGGGGGGGGCGGVQAQKSWKHDFEITGDPKCPPSGLTFWSGFEAPDS